MVKDNQRKETNHVKVYNPEQELGCLFSGELWKVHEHKRTASHAYKWLKILNNRNMYCNWEYFTGAQGNLDHERNTRGNRKWSDLKLKREFAEKLDVVLVSQGHHNKIITDKIN
jgi:hypothetical protein